MRITLIIILWLHVIFVAEGAAYRPLRYTHVTGQTDWYTCGAAAVSTLLTYYYSDEVSEQEVLEVAFAATQESGKDPLEGLTALSLKRTMRINFSNPISFIIPAKQAYACVSWNPKSKTW